MCDGRRRREEVRARNKAIAESRRAAKKAQEAARKESNRLIAQMEKDRLSMEAQTRDTQLKSEANRRADQLRMQTYSNYQTGGVQNAGRSRKKRSIASSRIRLNSALNIGQSGSTTNLG